MTHTTTRTQNKAVIDVYIGANVTTVYGYNIDTLEDFPKMRNAYYEDFESEVLFYFAELHNIDLEASEINYYNTYL